MLLQQVVKGSQRLGAGRWGRDAVWKSLPFWKQKSPLKSLDIMFSSTGPLPSPFFPLRRRRNTRDLCSLLLTHSMGRGDPGCVGQTLGVLVEALGLSCSVACGILVPRPGIEPMSPALEVRFLTTGPPGMSLGAKVVLSG